MGVLNYNEVSIINKNYLGRFRCFLIARRFYSFTVASTTHTRALTRQSMYTYMAALLRSSSLRCSTMVLAEHLRLWRRHRG